MQSIEATYADRIPEQLDRLAHHAFLGEVWDKAVVWSRQAATRAMARSAHSKAVVWCAHALRALDEVAPAKVQTEQKIDLHLLRATSLIPIVDFGSIVHHLKEAERLADTLGDRSRLGTVASFRSVHAWMVGDYTTSVDRAQRALDIATELNNLPLRVRANHSLGQAYHALGRYDQAVEALQRNALELRGDMVGRRFGLLGAASVLARSWTVWCLAELGQFDRAMSAGHEAVRIAEAINHPASRIPRTLEWGFFICVVASGLKSSLSLSWRSTCIGHGIVN